MCFLFYRGSCTKQTSYVKISASNAQSVISYCNMHLHTTNILTTARFLKLVWFFFGNETDLRASSWLHRKVAISPVAMGTLWSDVITSLHNTFVWSKRNIFQLSAEICDFFFAMKMQGLWNHASPAYFAQKSSIYAAKMRRIWKNAAPT